MTPSASGSRFLTSTVLFPGPRSQRLAALVERVSRAFGGSVLAYTWFRVDASVVDHPKVMMLAARLNDPNALAYVVRLWSWANRYAPDGRIKAELLPQMELAMRWTGAQNVVIEALITCGLLERSGETVLVHDWDEFQGRLFEKSKRDAKMKRLKRRTNGANAARAGRSNGAQTAPLHTDTTYTHTDTTKALRVASASRALSDDMCNLFESVRHTKYAFNGAKDAKALKWLMAQAEPPEILRRWRIGLGGEGWKSTSTFAQLRVKWNDLTTSPKAEEQCRVF